MLPLLLGAQAFQLRVVFRYTFLFWSRLHQRRVKVSFVVKMGNFLRWYASRKVDVTEFPMLNMSLTLTQRCCNRPLTFFHNCAFAGCVQWSGFNVQNSINGVNYPNANTLSDCLAECSSQTQCAAIDYDNSTSPCWLHMSSNDLKPDNTYGLPGVTQFIASRNCAPISQFQQHYTCVQNFTLTKNIFTMLIYTTLEKRWCGILQMGPTIVTFSF